MEYDTLTIRRSGSGYAMELSIYRLTSIDAYGQDRGGWLQMEGTDAAGNPIRFAVSKLSDGGVMLSVTGSTWTYLPTGETFVFH